jgi:hypothetical protein
MFRFTIRDVLWFVALLALASAWFADHRQLDSRLAKTQRDLREACFQLGLKPSPFD